MAYGVIIDGGTQGRTGRQATGLTARLHACWQGLGGRLAAWRAHDATGSATYRDLECVRYNPYLLADIGLTAERAGRQTRRHPRFL